MISTKSPMFLKNFSSVIINQVKCNSTRSVQEIRIPVPWGHIAGKWWGPTDQRPILTLHGWQDNCGSFDRLIPLLNEDVGFLAIDLPGHGYSSNLPSGLYYHHMNYIILVKYIVEYFSWPKISLMGHSMGAQIAYCFTMIYPKKVDFLICIDAAKPWHIEKNSEFRAYSIDKFLTYDKHLLSAKEPPSYSMDEIKRKMCSPNGNSIKYEHTHHIAERNVTPSKSEPGKYYLARDPRLKMHDLTSWVREEIIDASMGITCPILIGRGTQGFYYEKKEYFYEVLDILKKTSKDCVYKFFEGTHHFHLNTPKEFAKVAKEFIKKHNIDDRSIGVLKPEMLIKTTAKL